MTAAPALAPRGVFITPVERPQEGIPLAVKDLFDTAGLRTTYGSAIFGDHVPELSADAVTRLEAAGYATIGKANLHEFAWGITGENPHFGDTPNPSFPGRVAGGSSSGSAAALALGLADAALGSDSGGSVRIPAACCGVAGFKPSFGLISAAGCFPLAPSFDHVGPMARDVAGCAEMMRALAPALAPPAHLDPASVEVGVAWLAEADDDVRACVERAADAFGHRRSIELPFADGVANLFRREIAQVHEELWAEHRELYGAGVAAKMEIAMEVSDPQVTESLRERERISEAFAEAFDQVDLLLTPTLAMVPPSAGTGERSVRDAMTRFTMPLNAVGAPALAQPCGLTRAGLPASVQLAARPGADALVLAAAAALEARLKAAARHTPRPEETDRKQGA